MIIWTWTLLFILGSTALYQEPVADKLIRSATESTYQLHLADARTDAHELQLRYPDHPAGFLIEAESYWWEAQEDPGNRKIEDQYYHAHDLAQEKAERAIQAQKYYKPELLAYLASCYGSYARFEVTEKESYLSALRAGLKANDYAQQVYAIDKEYYDIYVGLGAFNYFAGTLPAMIKPFAWIIGVNGDTRLGVSQLNTAMQKARYSRTEARIVYYSALLSGKEYAAAFPILQSLISDYPDNFVLYDWAAEWFREQDKAQDSIDFFQKRYEEQLKRSALMAQYALFEKADGQLRIGQKSEAAQTLQKIRAIGHADALLLKRLESLQKDSGKQ